MSKKRLHLTFPEDLITEPVIYNMGKRFEVVTNIRRANVEEHSGWVILEAHGQQDQLDGAIAYFEGLGCTVNRMEGDVLES